MRQKEVGLGRLSQSERDDVLFLTHDLQRVPEHGRVDPQPVRADRDLLEQELTKGIRDGFFDDLAPRSGEEPDRDRRQDRVIAVDAPRTVQVEECRTDQVADGVDVDDIEVGRILAREDRDEDQAEQRCLGV